MFRPGGVAPLDSYTVLCILKYVPVRLHIYMQHVYIVYIYYVLYPPERFIHRAATLSFPSASTPSMFDHNNSIDDIYFVYTIVISWPDPLAPRATPMSHRKFNSDVVYSLRGSFNHVPCESKGQNFAIRYSRGNT